MAVDPTPLIMFLAFAQDRVDDARYLRNLPDEQRRIRGALQPAIDAGLCEVVERANATASDIFDVFQDGTRRNRIAVFHFGGHAGGAELLLESTQGAAATAHAAGLAQFLGEQRGLQLVFLNGCSSLGQVEGLLAAGISAVIATAQAIRDDVAADFAARFYAGLAGGATLRAAFAEAEGSVKSSVGSTARGAMRDARDASPVVDDTRWPWQLFVAAGAREQAEQWSLPSASRDPLYGLPPLPEAELPLEPFKHLHWFERSDAGIFFGRGRDIRRLYDALTDPVGAPIVLLFGATGVGKSSFLEAGLRPRLQALHEVEYRRRNRERGLTGALMDALGTPVDELPRKPWQRREAAGRPLIVILDQVEEAWTQPGAPSDIPDFSALLRDLFHAEVGRPQGRLLLSFRKEWLAEVLRVLDAERLPRSLHELGHLDRDGIIEAINGPASNDRLRARYHLRVQAGLADVIADDLLADRDSTVAPTLQILLTKFWQRAYARDPAAPQFSADDYESLRRQGLLLDDFVEEQLGALHTARAEDVDSGLALDLLAYHTTSLGSTESRSREDLHARYGNRPDVDPLIEGCKEGYLLIEHAVESTDQQGCETHATATRLAHDTLAPLIRRRHEASDRPGQQATRILEQRAREWQGGAAGPPLDAADLGTVEAGEPGMRIWTEPERRLLEASQAARRKQQQAHRLLIGAGVVAVVLVALFAVTAWVLKSQADAARLKAEAEAAKARDRAIAAVASTTTDPTNHLLQLLEVSNPNRTPTVVAQIVTLLADPLVRVQFQEPAGIVRSAVFNAAGDRVLTASDDNSARLWDAATGQSLQTFTGHAKSLLSAVFNAAGDRVLTASYDNSARLWDAATGQSLQTFTGHTSWVLSAVFNAAGDRVLTASNDNSARLWDAATGQSLRTFGHGGSVRSAVFNAAGDRVLTASNNSAHLWEATGRRLLTFRHTDNVYSAVFNAAGDRVLTASDQNSARLWDAVTGQSLRTFTGHTGSVRSAVFNAAGDRVLTASHDNSARLWHAATGQSLQTFTGHTGSVYSAVFNAAGDRVLTASNDNSARLWDAATGQSLQTFRHTGWVRSAVFNAAGDRVLTASHDNSARLWDAAAGQSLQTFKGHTGGVYSAVFDAAGDRVLTGSDDNSARFWDAATGQLLQTFTGHTGNVYSAVFNAASDRVLTASEDNSARLWDAATGQSLKTFTGHTSWVLSAVFDAAGDRVLTASSDNSARLWDAAGGQSLQTFTGHTGSVYSAVFNAAGHRVLTASEDNSARLWDAVTGQSLQTFTGHAKSVLSAVFNAASDRVLTASSDNSARLWDASTGQSLQTFTGHTGNLRSAVRSAVFNAAGDRVLTASDDNTARLWDATTGQSLQTFRGHTGRVYSAVFAAAGDRVLTASNDNSARLWDAATGRSLQTFKGHTGGVYSAVFDAAGDRVLTASSDNSARLWAAAGELLQARARASTRLCLDARTRAATLDEAPSTAESNEAACKICVPKFFVKLGPHPGGDAQRYLDAWRSYKSCLRNPLTGT